MLKITLFTKTEDKPSYKDSEEYLKKQQDIDTMLIMTKIVETTDLSGDTKEKARVIINKTLDKL